MKEVYMKIGRMVHKRGKLTLDWKRGTYVQEVTAETRVLLPHSPSRTPYSSPLQAVPFLLAFFKNEKKVFSGFLKSIQGTSFLHPCPHLSD